MMNHKHCVRCEESKRDSKFCKCQCCGQKHGISVHVYSKKTDTIYVMFVAEVCGNCEHLPQCREFMPSLTPESQCDFDPSLFSQKEVKSYAA